VPVRGVLNPRRRPQRVPEARLPNFPPNTAWYTRSIAYSLLQFGSVRVLCNTVSVGPGVAASRIYNAAYRLGIKVRTNRQYSPTAGQSVVGTVIHEGTT